MRADGGAGTCSRRNAEGAGRSERTGLRAGEALKRGCAAIQGCPRAGIRACGGGGRKINFAQVRRSARFWIRWLPDKVLSKPLDE